MHNIIEGLAGLAVPIDSITPLDGNPRRGDVEAVARSLERFGQRKPVVVNSTTGHVEAGNHTLAAAKLLGWDEVAAVMVADDHATATGFALADNRTADLATYDDEALADMVRDVMENDASLLSAASFTDDDLDDLLAELSDADVGMLGDPAKTPSERETGWEASAIRSVLLAYGFARYAWVVRQLAELRKALDVESNAEVVATLIADRVGETPPPEAAGPPPAAPPDDETAEPKGKAKTKAAAGA